MEDPFPELLQMIEEAHRRHGLWLRLWRAQFSGGLRHWWYCGPANSGRGKKCPDQEKSQREEKIGRTRPILQAAPRAEESSAPTVVSASLAIPVEKSRPRSEP